MKSNQNIIGIIPARMASSRFPGKPLASILGVPMLGHVFKRSKLSRILNEVYVATCDQEIANYIQSIGGKAVMTSDKHVRASDRTAECLVKVEAETGKKVDIVVMIQGDEPMIRPEMIDSAVAPLLEDNLIQVVNLMSTLKNRIEQDDPNEVKVVVDQHNFALYFSREPIPSWKKGAKSLLMLKQVCVIPFRRDFLIKFNRLEPTPLEIAESVDMLRVLEHGYKIKMVMSDHETYSVDNIEDLKKVEKIMRKEKNQ
ncbi:MAG: 3-deoxy-manno-octulosonate cytidylyltransferase (CMP-KDO synthetase) [Candidatus Saganbacteria bacterium]|uniref:3-deoxy-manno-octulosonate cytidylyltransferase n=1 Tax=Candidatus Saganbacteria bacterium TaxID=2575572 RepID=A0A833L2J9_UNCSA|nr:MAG: 3-deoxy-manno-octulosonate cytidylyltransferase (CMP-KDO synthetase) [Candidatus Saganbacteria bacterium]